MSFRFRKSVRLFPGVRLNLSRSGMSVSVGGPGATVNLSRRGTAVTLGFPGTGLSYRHQFVPSQRGQSEDQRGAGRAPPAPLPDAVPPGHPSTPHGASQSRDGEIRSAEVVGLTTPDLQGLKRMINEAAAQRASLAPDLAAALASRERAWRRLRRREQLPLRLVLAGTVPKARAAFEEAESEALDVIEALALSEVRVAFALDEPALAAQRALAEAHAHLSRAHRVWDVLSSVAVDRVRERSTASAAITRTPVAFSTAVDGVVAADQAGLRFQNANGADLDLFPGFLLMRDHGATDYALIDIREVDLRAEPVRFIEDEVVPGDAQVVGHAWAKANRDGSPDRRFRDNRQIPIALYGAMHFSTTSGVREAYHVSDCERALSFGAAFRRLQSALEEMARRAPTEELASRGDVAAVDLASRLPGLPAVRGAHEFTALAAAALVALVALLATHAGGAPRSPAPPPVAAAGQAIQPYPQVASTPTRAVEPPPDLATPRRQADGAVASSEAGKRDRVLTRTAVNLRVGPDAGAAIVRVMPVGTALDVFARDGRWVLVGQGGPWGWAHDGVLRPAP